MSVKEIKTSECITQEILTLFHENGVCMCVYPVFSYYLSL